MAAFVDKFKGFLKIIKIMYKLVPLTHYRQGRALKFNVVLWGVIFENRKIVICNFFNFLT